jgi:hypothetical protein
MAVQVMSQNREFFQPFLEPSWEWEPYLEAAKQPGFWATNSEVQALAFYLRKPITIYKFDRESPDNVMQSKLLLEGLELGAVTIAGLLNVTDLIAHATIPDEDTLTIS